MRATSIMAIFALFWVMSAFLVLPFGVRTHHEQGPDGFVPGQAESAPANFSARRVIVRATVLAMVLFGLYFANYVNGWVTPQDLNLFPEPPDEARL